jgi:hypothetical protein
MARMRRLLAVVGLSVVALGGAFLAFGARDARPERQVDGRAPAESPEPEAQPAELHAVDPLGDRARAEAPAPLPPPVAAPAESTAKDARHASDAGPEPTQLVVRLIDELAQPFADRRVSVQTVDWTMTLFSQGSTDEAGLFWLPVSVGPGQQAELPKALDFDAGGGRGARLTLPADLEVGPGVIDLGDLVLGGMPLIASGIVRNPAGVPVPYASITASLLHRDPDGRENSAGVTITRMTRDDGLFDLHGWIEGATHVRLSTTHQAAARGSEVELPIGTAGVVITLSGGGAIEGRLVLDEDLRASSILLAAENESPGGRGAAGVRLMPEQRILLPKLEPGVYTLRVQLEGDGEELYSLAGIVVRNGERTRPPELDPLDLRGRAFRHAITVVEPGGAPVPATVYTRSSDDARWASEKHAPGAPAIVYSKSDTLDVTATARGFGWCERSGVTGAATLVLGSLYEVHVRLSDATALPEGMKLTGRLVPRGERWRTGMGSESAPFGPDGTCVIFAKGIGEHTLKFGVDGMAYADPKPAEIVIDVTASAALDVHSIDAPRDEIDRMIRHWERYH